jgi:hypothetical protein
VEDGGEPRRGLATTDDSEEADDEQRVAAARRVADGGLAAAMGVGTLGLSSSCELVMLWPAPGLPYMKAQT